MSNRTLMRMETPTPEHKYPHGTWQRYQRLGCRCDECRPAASAYTKHLRHQRGDDDPLVPADESRQHIRDLLDGGMPFYAIMERSGLPKTTIDHIMRHNRFVTTYSHTKVMAVELDTSYTPFAQCVSPVGAARRLQHLAWLGWSMQKIHELSGVGITTMKRIRGGDAEQIKPDVDQRIRDAARKLTTQKPPAITKQEKSAVARIQNTARRNGWVSIFAWEDPDDVASACYSTETR